MTSSTQLKRCCSCKEEKELGLFGKNRSRPDGLHEQCKECRARDNFKWKPVALEMLGGVRCCECGFEDIRALDIDHVNNDGNIERAETKDHHRALWKKIATHQVDLSKYQVLCRNCNWIKNVENLKAKRRKL